MLSAQAIGKSGFHNHLKAWFQRTGRDCHSGELTKPKDGSMLGDRLSGLGNGLEDSVCVLSLEIYDENRM